VIPYYWEAFQRLLAEGIVLSGYRYIVSKDLKLRMGGLVEELVRLAKLYHLLTPVRVASLKDLGVICLDTEWSSVGRGEEVSIPLWLAHLLESSGAIEIREQGLNEVDIGRYLVVEKGLKTGEFQKLKSSFYMEAGRLINDLRTGSRASTTTERLLKIARIEADLEDLMRIRLRKLIHVAFLGGKLEGYLDSLTIEESALLNSLTNTLSRWLRAVKGV